MSNEQTINKQATNFAQQARQGGRCDGERILAQGHTVSNDTWLTHMNNNDLIVGTTGSGKTRNYVKPNLLQMNESFIVTDTKGALIREVGPTLERHGYEVIHLDFTEVGQDITLGYNPLDYIRRTPLGNINEQDVMRVANAICPIEENKEPFWDRAACMCLAAIVGYVMEAVPEEERTLSSVARLVGYFGSECFDGLFADYESRAPHSFAVRKFKSFKNMKNADRMTASIAGIMAEKVDPLSFEGADRLYTASKRIDFRKLGTRRIALFLTVSDTDHSLDRLVGLLYSQALNQLINFADDDCPCGALPVPVRLYLDDFATNCKIEEFDKIISVIRSRNISVSVVLQSLTQLDGLYGAANAKTIVNGCDHMVYLGGRDLASAEYVSQMADVSKNTVLSLPLGRAYLVETGRKARLVTKYRLEDHPLYAELGEKGVAVAVEHEKGADGPGVA